MSADTFKGQLVHLSILDPEKDAELISAWMKDSEYDRLQDAGVAYLWSPGSVKEWMEKEAGGYVFMIRTLADDRPIGFIDLGGFAWGPRSAWVGIGLGEREFWGKGYGTDAMRILLRYAFEELNLNRVNLDVFEYNLRAQKSYLKCGFQTEGRARKAMRREGRRWDIIYMGILRSDWQALVKPGFEVS